MKINKWTVTQITSPNKWGVTEYLCICDCGTERYQQLSTLAKNRSKGCMSCRRVPMEKKYGKWTIISEAGSNRHNQIIYNVKCDCGFEKIVRKWTLITGSTTQCNNCAFKENSKRALKHGLTRTKVYAAWSDMKARCLNQTHVYYKNYGARGIKIYEPWLEFVCFFKDMGHVPNGMQLGRKDVNKDYTPDNTIWTTAKKNMSNRTNSRQRKLD